MRGIAARRTTITAEDEMLRFAQHDNGKTGRASMARHGSVMLCIAKHLADQGVRSFVALRMTIRGMDDNGRVGCT